MSRTTLLDALRAELDAVENQIAAHPWNTEVNAESRRVIDEYQQQGKEKVEKELAARGLPNLTESGKTVARGLWSFSRLQQKKNRLERKIERLSDLQS